MNRSQLRSPGSGMLPFVVTSEVGIPVHGTTLHVEKDEYQYGFSFST